MKSSLEIQGNDKYPQFPGLYIHKDEGFVVLFTTHSRGTIVYSERPALDTLGERVSNLTESYFKAYYLPFDGKVILSS